MARGLRAQAREALQLHGAGKHEEAVARGVEIAAENPGSALALNLVGSLHRYSGSVAWKGRASDDDEAASALELHHNRLALDAFSAAAQIAPNCVMTAIAHAEALAGCGRIPDAQVELYRICSIPEANHVDPAVHHVGYDMIGGANAKMRKCDAVSKANAIMQDFETLINKEIVPIEAAKLLGGDAAADEVRRRARLCSQCYPFSARAQLLCVYIELQHVRALDLAADRKRHLRRILALVSDAAVTFDCSLLIALFHAKVLFVLDEFDESERECRRALRIEEPTDPNLDDIPPAVSVPGADFDARVSSVKKELRVFLKHIIVVAALYWCSIKSTPHRERIISVKVHTLQEHYNTIDQSAAKTISDALRFLKNQGSWSFFICTSSRCDGKKFLDTRSLWQHMRNKHRDELWEKLQSVLGPDINENASKDDHSLDGITLCQDSGQHDIFQLPEVQDMFESLLVSPSIGISAEPLAEMRQRKCREGSEILEDIKEKLKMLPEDTLSTEFEGFCFGMQNLWLKFLKVSLLDYREVILPLARSFQWIEMKQWIAENVNDPNRSISDASFDAVFGKVPAALDHQSGDDLQPEKLKPSCADETLKADEKCEESEVRVVNSNSGTVVEQSSSDPPTDVDESVMNIAVRIAEVELDKKGTSGQSVKEIGSTSSCQQSLNVFNNNADKDLSILSLTIQSLCNLSHFRDMLLTEPLAWIPSVDNPCIAQKFYEIFSSWEKNDHRLTDVVLTYMKTLLCRIVNCTTFFEKLQAGTNFASEIVATILIGLHMSETFSRCRLNKETQKHVVNPITCGYCICPTHNLFGINFNAQMSCQCGKCSGEYLYTALFHKLDAGSPQTTKIKSFAELPVLLDEQFYKDNNCEDCGTLQNNDLFLSNTPHFFTIVLNWLGGIESQDTLSEVMSGITSPLDTAYFCKSANSSTLYTVTSMICYADERYVCLARDDEDKWLIYDSEIVETEDTWEHLLERFKDSKLQPEVLFFEVIK
uniref:Uncharacterized protein n=1 Tax=Avena sativa TaxID=4498 RepID=A0ACD5YLW3_AVESA